MEFRILEKADTIAAKKLWKAAFADPDAFIDLYFARRVKSGNSIGLFDGGTLACCLHLIPYIMDIRGIQSRTFYITGAATEAEYRNRGLMARLLKEALKLLSGRGIPFTHLYPFLHAFYEKFGWATYTHMKTAPAAGAMSGAYTVSRTPDSAGMARLYREFTKAFTGHIVRDEADFSYMLDEAACGGGRTAFAYRGGELGAYAFYEVREAKAVCQEAVFGGAEALNALVHGIKEMESVKTAEIPLPAAMSFDGSSGAKPYGMARVADTKTLLSSLGLQNISLVIEVQDAFAPWNAGVFEAAYGSGGSAVARTAKKPQLTIDVRDLAKLVHGTAGVLELEKNGGATVLDRGIVQPLDKAFPARNTFVFETY